MADSFQPSIRTCLLVQELLAAKRDLKLSWTIKKLAKYEAIVIDDLAIDEDFTVFQPDGDVARAEANRQETIGYFLL